MDTNQEKPPLPSTQQVRRHSRSFTFDLSRIHQDDLRIIVALSSLLLAGIVLTVLSFALKTDGIVAIVLIDRQSPLYPLTVQNILHVLFVLGIGEVFVRLYSASDARNQLMKNLIGHDGGQHFTESELKNIQQRIREDGGEYHRHLHRLIHRVIQQYLATGSVGDAQSVLDSSIEYFQHEITLRYTMLRYLTWVLPTLGFIGTLIGISIALAGTGTLPNLEDHAALEAWIGNLTSDLGVAFYTTLVALVLAAILVFSINIASEREQSALNETGQYCLDNLISRLQNQPMHLPAPTSDR